MKKILYPELVGEMAKRGESQNTLAELLGTTYWAIHRRMLGVTEWTMSEIDKVCEYYGKSYDDLFKKNIEK